MIVVIFSTIKIKVTSMPKCNNHLMCLGCVSLGSMQTAGNQTSFLGTVLLFKKPLRISKHYNHSNQQVRMTMIIINLVTSVYFSSMLIMALYTNIRPLFYINIRNETEVIEEAGNTDDAELGDADIIIIVNLLILSVVSKWNFIKHNRNWN